MRSLYQQTNYQTELNNAKKMSVKELEKITGEEWNEYFPLFTRKVDLEKIIKDESTDGRTKSIALLELLAMMPHFGLCLFPPALTQSISKSHTT